MEEPFYPFDSFNKADAITTLKTVYRNFLYEKYRPRKSIKSIHEQAVDFGKMNDQLADLGLKEFDFNENDFPIDYFDFNIIKNN